MNGASMAVERDSVPLPNGEELRMVRAIARLALLEAARHGEYRATFRGVRIRAVRQGQPLAGEDAIEVSLRVDLGEERIEHCLVSAVDVLGGEPTP
jgi:hypothetical protein